MSFHARLQRMPAPVRSAFAALPEEPRRALLEARALVFEAAAGDARIGALTEALRWGEPAYLTEATGSGSTLRLGLTRPGGAPAMFVNCRTGLAAEIRDRCGGVFGHEGARALVLPADAGGAAGAIRHAAWLALTHHLRKRVP